MPGKKNDVMSRIRLKRSDSGVKLLGKNYCWKVKKSGSAGSTADSMNAFVFIRFFVLAK
jgi:hypothetical protein